MGMKHNEFLEEVQKEYKWAKETFTLKDPVDVVNSYIAERMSEYLKEESITMQNWYMRCVKKWLAVRDLLIADKEKATENQ